MIDPRRRGQGRLPSRVRFWHSIDRSVGRHRSIFLWQLWAFDDPKQPFLRNAGSTTRPEGDTREDRGPVVRLITRPSKGDITPAHQAAPWPPAAPAYEPAVDRREQLTGFGALDHLLVCRTILPQSPMLFLGQDVLTLTPPEFFEDYQAAFMSVVRCCPAS
jgi:hypothetical protein